MLRWREIGGRPGEGLYDRLHQRIGRYQEGHPLVLICMTTDPMRRWSEHRNDGWKEMVMLYSTSNQAFAGDVRGGLVARGWEDRFGGWDYGRERERLAGDYLRYYLYVLIPWNGSAG